MTAKRENGSPYPWLLVAAGLLLLFYLLREILPPFLIAAILAYICSPLVDHLQRLRLGRTPATALVMLLLASLFVAVLLVVIPLLQKEIMLLAERLPSYVATLRARLDPWLMQHFGVALEIDLAQLQGMLGQHWQSAGNLAGRALLLIGSRGTALLGWLTSLLLVPLVLFYLLRDWPRLMALLGQLLPRRWHGKSVQIASEIDRVLAEFLRGQLSVMLLMSVFYACGLWLAGLELALPIGLVAGMLGFVPYLGIATGLLLALLSAALQFTSLGAFVPVLLVFGLGQLLEGFVLTPWLVGERIGLHPLAVIFALLAGGALFGFAGILLALPAGAAIAVGLRHLKQAYLASDTYQ